VNARQDGGNDATPLHLAASENHRVIAELLISSGADINALSSENEAASGTPLDWAIEFDGEDVAQLLRQHGGHQYTGQE